MTNFLIRLFIKHPEDTRSSGARYAYGRLAGAVTETMISGNFAALLQNLRGISRETACDGSTVLPWAAFDGVTVK